MSIHIKKNTLQTIVIIIGLILPFQLGAQNQQIVDSLQQALVGAEGKGRVEVLANLAANYRWNNLEQTEKYAGDAIALAKEIGYKEGEGMAYFYWGWARVTNRDLRKGLELYNKSLELIEATGNQAFLAQVYNGFGGLYRYDNEYKLAQEYYEKAYRVYEKEKDWGGMAAVNKNLGDCMTLQGKLKEAKDYVEAAIEIQKSHKLDQTNLGYMYYSLGRLYRALKEYDSAEVEYEQGIAVFHSMSNLGGMARGKVDLGLMYRKAGNYALALEKFFMALKEFEAAGMEERVASVYNSIGVTYYQQKSYVEAIEYYRRSLAFRLKFNDQSSAARLYSNIGVAHQYLMHFDSAEIYYLKCIEIVEPKNSKARILGWAYNGMGGVRQYEGKYKEAKVWIQKAIEIREKLKNADQLVQSYNSMGKNYLLQKQYAAAKEWYTEAEQLCQKDMTLLHYKDALEGLSMVYEGEGNVKKAFAYYKHFKSVSDSLINDKSKKALLEQVMQYAFDKEKDQLAEESKQDQLAHEQEIKIHRSVNYILMIGVLVVGVLGFFMLRAYREKQAANQELEERHEEILHQREEILIINEKLSAKQEDLLMKSAEAQLQYEMLEEVNQKMMDSINYASRIQKAILGDSSEITNQFKDAFVLFKPKDIVSGDFYWYTQRNEGQEKILITADCTGHGVPGAFMTVMGASLLNEVINNNDVFNPREILEELDRKIIAATNRQELHGGERLNDGMDMQVVLVDDRSSKLYFAGAKNPLYRIRAGEIEMFKGAKFPVGSTQYKKGKAFELIELDIQSGDKFYLASDGFQDQFGGKQGKKFLRKRFRELLLSSSEEGMNNQKEKMKKVLKSWSRGYRQTDDILVVGFEVSTWG